MTSFLYFIATDKHTLTAADLAAAGLSHVIERGNPLVRSVLNGPGGLSGLIFASDGSTARFVPSEQSWRAFPCYQIGYSTADGKPGPAELVRARAVRGESVELGDGRTWEVPTVCTPFGAGSLPTQITLGPDGKTWKQASLPEHAGLIAAAEQWFALLTKEPDPKKAVIPIDETMRQAIAALAVNYRVGPAEVSILELFTSQTVVDVCQAACGYAALARAIVAMPPAVETPSPEAVTT